MKRLIAILLTLVIAFSLVGCENSGSSENAESSEKWYCLGSDSDETFYVNIDFEDLDIGTYNIAYCIVQGKRDMISNDKIAPGILFVYEDRYLITSASGGVVSIDK